MKFINKKPGSDKIREIEYNLDDGGETVNKKITLGNMKKNVSVLTYDEFMTEMKKICSNNSYKLKDR